MKSSPLRGGEVGNRRDRPQASEAVHTCDVTFTWAGSRAPGRTRLARQDSPALWGARSRNEDDVSRS